MNIETQIFYTTIESNKMRLEAATNRYKKEQATIRNDMLKALDDYLPIGSKIEVDGRRGVVVDRGVNIDKGVGMITVYSKGSILQIDLNFDRMRGLKKLS